MQPVDFDDLLLSRVRLGIIAALVQSDALSFPELKDLLGVTQGNLGAHLQKLEDGGYVEVTKEFVGKRPRTTAQLTTAGRTAFRKHVERLAAVAAAPTSSKPTRGARSRKPV